MQKPVSIVFLGSSELSIPTLNTLLASSKYKIEAVITQPDRPVGRKKILTPTPLKAFAQQYTLKIIHDLNYLLTSKAQVGILVSYGQLLKKNHLEALPGGILNLHPSLLPQWRGPSPIQYAILSGNTTTGVTIMQLDTGMDSGPIITQKPTTITEQETAQDLHDRLAIMGADMLDKCILPYLQKEILPFDQDHKNATYTKKITREDGKIISSLTIEEIYTRWRAYYPWPGIYCEWKNKRIKILRMHKENNNVRIDTVQIAGKQPMSYKDFLLGYPDFSFTNIT